MNKSFVKFGTGLIASLCLLGLGGCQHKQNSNNNGSATKSKIYNTNANHSVTAQQKQILNKQAKEMSKRNKPLGTFKYNPITNSMTLNVTSRLQQEYSASKSNATIKKNWDKLTQNLTKNFKTVGKNVQDKGLIFKIKDQNGNTIFSTED